MTMPIKYSDKTDTKQIYKKRKTLKSLTTSLYTHRTGQNNIYKKETADIQHFINSRERK